MPTLTVEELEVRFPGLDTPALAIPRLGIAAGARIGLTGPSGSGKTTLLNLITGLERAGTGRILWDGTDIARLSEGRRDRWRAANVGLVMQDFHLFDGLSARDNVLLPLRLARFALPAGAGEEADRLLGRVGIERRGQKVETLSRGQKQRVAVARALIARPGILIADEPTASLDAEAGAVVAALLTELAMEAGATLIVASHDPRLLERLDRVVRLEAGRIRPAEG
ncbi:putative ABC transport system ATP-binding protein [Ancylobacter sp. 3268]|uniref:ABC transporter ATP-binding protein n=1 Tax=Ancylobacter sp. 3268 TaxID=2817752 RepID=UPI00285A26BB|nr:ABC transporter ATP-binding protein [Ancylobacter sp. 3268]MDR6952278.1 putative ABC transport system ATP-binding protein [Ancylobacter sp. 3268]